MEARQSRLDGEEFWTVVLGDAPPFGRETTRPAYGLSPRTVRWLAQALLLAALLAMAPAIARSQTVRVKDIANVQGVRGNQLVGYGLVIGLDGSGDSQQTKFTAQSVASMLDKFGVTMPGTALKVRNVAAVMVTADLPPFVRTGARIDVIVSSLGDARTLQGGTLVQTPLQGADGEVYAVAQGPLTLGGYTAGGGGGGGGSTVTRNHPTVGRIPGGAYVEKDVSVGYTQKDVLTISLNDPDFATASRIAAAINKKLGGSGASAEDPASVRVRIPPAYAGKTVDFLALIDDASVTPDTIAKVVVNERTGTIVIGGNVKLSPVALSHGGLHVEISKTPAVSQPMPDASGQTVTTEQTTVTTTEEPSNLRKIDEVNTVDDLIKSLNALKATPRDIIAILQAMKQAGALHAELDIL
jgi:flagellar P-ring protein precursor FlgI